MMNEYVYDKISVFLLNIVLIVLFFVDKDFRSMESLPFFLLVFLPMLYFSITYAFKKKRNIELEKLLLIYIVMVTFLVGLAVAMYSVKANKGWFVLLAIINFYYSIYTFFKMMKKGPTWIYVEYDWKSILLSVIVCSVIFIVSEWILHLYWANVFSIVLIYLSMLQHRMVYLLNYKRV